MAEYKNKNQYQISESDFQLVQSKEKIFDKALDTKPTTFAKDAFKRFCKNKSSVVGAIIIGILILLAIFVPVISTKDITRTSSPEELLPPKLFEAGTGFWDGTQKKVDVAYDTVKQMPVGYDMPTSILNLVVDENPTYINTAQSYGLGGYVMFENSNVHVDATDVYLSSFVNTFTSNGDFVFSASLHNENGILGGELAEYAIYLTSTNNGFKKDFLLKDWSKEYGNIQVNISDALKEQGESKYTGSISFIIKKNTEKTNYLLIEKCGLTSNDNVLNKDEIIQSVSFDDATKMVLVTKEKSEEELKEDKTLSKINTNYWTCNGRKGIYQSKIYLCDFTFDKYEQVYGKKSLTVTKTELDNYVKSGWCSYDPKDPINTFKVLNAEKCPIQNIETVQLNSTTGKLLTATCSMYKYRELKYDTMPKFLFGTNKLGQDLFKKSFTGLRTSLLLGVCTAAFCFAFGLCWGAISGYFGGNVDIFMERFCELLGGVPWIVIMTLCILHLGNNAVTFIIALCLTGWMGTAGRTRTQFYRFKNREYVYASRTLGASDFRLIFKHILPNSMGTIITGSVLMITSVIFSEANIAYLNLGLQGVESFGVMMSENQQYLGTYPNLVIFPAVIISLLMISFNLFGNGLRDAFNPSLKGSE